MEAKGRKDKKGLIGRIKAALDNIKVKKKV